MMSTAFTIIDLKQGVVQTMHLNSIDSNLLHVAAKCVTLMLSSTITLNCRQAAALMWSDRLRDAQGNQQCLAGIANSLQKPPKSPHNLLCCHAGSI